MPLIVFIEIFLFRTFMPHEVSPYIQYAMRNKTTIVSYQVHVFHETFKLLEFRLETALLILELRTKCMQDYSH